MNMGTWLLGAFGLFGLSGRMPKADCVKYNVERLSVLPASFSILEEYLDDMAILVEGLVTVIIAMVV